MIKPFVPEIIVNQVAILGIDNENHTLAATYYVNVPLSAPIPNVESLRPKMNKDLQVVLQYLLSEGFITTVGNWSIKAGVIIVQK